MAQLLGFSNEHSSFIARNFSLATGFVSPQFHVVFDDLFSTVYSDTKLKDSRIKAIYHELIESSCGDYYGEEPESPSEEDLDDPPPELVGERLSKPER